MTGYSPPPIIAASVGSAFRLKAGLMNDLLASDSGWVELFK